MADEAKVIDVEAEGEKVAPASKELVVVDKGEGNLAVPMPVVVPEEAKRIMKEYEALKAAIVEESDIDRHGNKPYLKKSYWRKLATFFRLSVEAVEGTETDRMMPDGIKCYKVQYKATAPNGRYCFGDGNCSTDERGKQNWSWMQLMATASTRAFNRAVSNLVGGGEVSAEEVDVPFDAEKHRADKEVTHPVASPKKPASDKQVNYMKALLKGNQKITSEILLGWMPDGKTELEQLSSAEISQLIEMAKGFKG